MTTFRSNLRIARRTDEYIWAYCPFHNDMHTANMKIDLKGEFAGKYHCFACGADGRASDLGVIVNEKPTKTKRPKIEWNNWLNGQLAKYPIGYEDLQACRTILADELGVDVHTLALYNHAWVNTAHVFPMLSYGEIVGYQRRYPSGRKITVKGSRLGLFLPAIVWDRRTMVICEGLSDTLVASECGFTAIGRPNASACIKETIPYCSQARLVIIVPDNDSVGRRGAQALQQALQGTISGKVAVCAPPPEFKDLRAFYGLAGRQGTIDYLKGAL